MPALLPFLPAASRFLLGEDIQLPSVATYWCGGQRELSHALSHLDSLVFRPAFAITGQPPINPAAMNGQQREELIRMVRDRPSHFVAQERLAHSTIPVWHDGELRSWHLALRTFHVQAGDEVSVLPGGLSRVSDDEGKLEHSSTTGRLSQDCWVCSDQPVEDHLTLLPRPDTPIPLTRSGDELPSRVAESLFWLGRYVERCEAVARLLRTALIRLGGEQDMGELSEMPRLVAALATIGQIEPDYVINELGRALPDLEVQLPASVFDADQPRGLQAAVRSVLFNASAIRDRISIDAYRIIKRIGDDLATPGPVQTGNIAPAIERLNRVITNLLAFSGLLSESITRTHGWRFLELGRRIERTHQTAELLSATLVPNNDDETSLFEAVLETTDSLMTYRSRYMNVIRPEPVIDLLVTDETNPRSIRFQLERVKEMLRDLPADTQEVGMGPDQRIAEDLAHLARMADVNALCRVHETARRESLAASLERIIHEAPRLSEAITARYLIHTSVAQALTGEVAVKS
jgi:uncharacterized alpha-E superfamily protein